MKRVPGRPLTLADVSRHRTALYGFAALWIVLNHTGSTFSGPVGFLLNAVRLLGACGVEMFVLLSGVGLYRSLERDPDIVRFYKRRLQRVFLPAFIAALVFYGLQSGSASAFVLKITFIGFWFGKSTFWYVPFILLMYLLYPAIYRLQKRSPKALWGLFALSMIVSLIACCFDTGWTRVCLVAVVRVPAFLLGCILAPCFNESTVVPRKAWLILPAASLLFLWPTALLPWPYYGFTRLLAYLCLGAFMILLLTRVFDLMTCGGAGRTVYRFFAFCGGFSLELYLIFERLLNLLKQLPGGISPLKLDMLTLLLSLILAPLLAQLCRMLVRLFGEAPVPNEKNA